MCATNLWAIDPEAFTPAFQAFTAERMETDVEVSEHRIVSRGVRRSAVVFTLTWALCDCDTLIGRRNDPAAEDEASAEAWLGWLRGLPQAVPEASSIAVLRAWSPQETVVKPKRVRSVGIAEVTEELLRDLRDGTLLTMAFRTGLALT